MPNIREFQPPNLGLQPSEIGVDATAAAARRIGSFYNQAGQAITDTGQRVGSAIRDVGEVAVKSAEHHEVSTGSANFAKLQDDLTKQWNETAKNADPNDSSVAQKFREEVVEPRLQQFGDSFLTEGGQNFATSHVAALREHIFQKTTADMSSMAAIAVHTNYNQTVNRLSSTVRADPSSLDFSLKTVESSVGALADSSPNLSAVDAAKVKSELGQKAKEQIVKSAALGQIEKTGVVPEWATDPKYSPYINGVELKQLAQAARFYQKQGESADRAARAEQEHGAKLKFNAAVNDLELSMTDPETGLPVVSADHVKKLSEIVQKNPLGAALEPGRVASTKNAIDTAIRRMNQAQAPAAQSRQVAADLIQRLGTDDDTRITNSAEIFSQSEKMRDADFRMVMSAFNHAKTDDGRILARTRNEFFKDHALALDPSFGTNEEGQRKVFFAKQEALRQEDVLRKEGKDPNLVYQARSDNPYYFGRPENLARFKASLQSLMEGAAKPEPSAETPKVGARKQFKQGWGVWNGTTYVPEGK